MYSISTLRKKAKEAGYFIEKGFQHYMYNGCVVTDDRGKRLTGYMVQDLSTGFYEWGCYDQCFDHLWTLEDVEEFLKGIYEKYDMKW